MTSKTTTLAQQTGELERFPDYPPRDDMQNWLYLYETSVLTSLAIHFADEPNVTVASEVPVGPGLPVRDDARIPDLLMVRDGDRELMEEQRGYAIDRQGKAPDFVLEVASRSTGRGGLHGQAPGLRAVRHPGVLALRPEWRRVPRCGACGGQVG